MTTIADPRFEFFENLHGLAQTLQIRFPECTHCAAVVDGIAAERESEAKMDVRIIQWYLKMKSFLAQCQKRDDAGLAKAGSFGFFEECELVSKVKSLPADDQDNVWQFLNNCNAMCVLYDQQSEDTPFNDITAFAEKLMLLFPKDKIKNGGYVEIMRHVPAMISNDEFQSLIAKLGAHDDRLDRVFGLMELQFGTTIEESQRNLIAATLKQATATLANDQTKQVLSTVTAALPDFLAAGQSALSQLFQINPELRGVADAVLASTGLGGGRADDSTDQGLTLDELEAAAAAATE